MFDQKSTKINKNMQKPLVSLVLLVPKIVTPAAETVAMPAAGPLATAATRLEMSAPQRAYGHMLGSMMTGTMLAHFVRKANFFGGRLLLEKRSDDTAMPSYCPVWSNLTRPSTWFCPEFLGILWSGQKRVAHVP